MKRIIVFVSVSIVTLGMLGWYLYPWTRQQMVRDALPQYAVKEMKEFYEHPSMLPDFTHCVKVKIDQESFKNYVVNLELESGTKLKEIPQKCRVDWWDPPSLKDVVYQYPGTNQEMGEIAIYKNGLLYYIAWNS